MKKFLLTLLVFFGFNQSNVIADNASNTNAFSFSFESIEGGDLNLDQYKGKALLVVNTASLCGFTGQYEGLQTLWDNYKDKGLVVIGVRANNFKSQEPGNDGEIKESMQHWHWLVCRCLHHRLANSMDMLKWQMHEHASNTRNPGMS